jgi:hypothetical protein
MDAKALRRKRRRARRALLLVNIALEMVNESAAEIARAKAFEARGMVDAHAAAMVKAERLTNDAEVFARRVREMTREFWPVH